MVAALPNLGDERKVNFVPGKIPSGARVPENVYIHVVYQPSRRLNISCKVWLTSVERRRCSNEGKTRNPLKFAGVPQTGKSISAISGQAFTIL